MERKWWKNEVQELRDLSLKAYEARVYRLK